MFDFPEVAVIGAAIVDIPLAPVSAAVFDAHSTPLSRIAMAPGGDALNEALTAAGIEVSMTEPPAKPDGEMPFARPEGEDGMKLPEDTGNSKT